MQTVINSLYTPQLAEGHKGVKSKTATKMAIFSFNTCYLGGFWCLVVGLHGQGIHLWYQNRLPGLTLLIIQVGLQDGSQYVTCLISQELLNLNQKHHFGV